ncbi:MAG: hypothetical protein M3O35_12280 [Acidobacteriota bacterium]|nr:hypothetical protein [Acidobacteriota bacterium]
MRNAIGLLLRIYAYLYHVLLALLLLALGVAALSTGRDNLSLGMLPWEGGRLTQALLVLGVVGLLCVLLAVTGWLRFLFPLWTLLILVLMIRGYFVSPYTFSGEDEFKEAIWLTVGALIAFLASLSLFGRRKRA